MKSNVLEANRWPEGSTPGHARLRRHKDAEKIRLEVLADQEAAAACAAAAITAENAKAMTEALAAGRDVMGDVEPAASAPKVAAVARKAVKACELSAGAAQILRALFHVAGDGGWIDQKAIPHGLVGRAVSGYLGGLCQRKLVDLRVDGGGKYSARLTSDGFAALALKAEEVLQAS